VIVLSKKKGEEMDIKFNKSATVRTLTYSAERYTLTTMKKRDKREQRPEIKFP
jgi:hypothetical protein